MTDPLKIVADLRPARLDELTERAYQQRREADLSRAMAGVQAVPGSPHYPGRAGRPRAWRWALVSGGGVLSAAAAVTALAVTGAFAGGAALPAHPRTGAGAQSGASSDPATVATLDARTVMLASAQAVSRAPATSGTYWYVKERDYGTAWARPQDSKFLPPPAGKKPVSPGTKALGIGGFYAATEESWIGQSRARTIVNEDLVYTFASPADKARWDAAGRPPLSNPAGFASTGARTSDYSMTLYFGYGSHRLSLDKVRKLPGSEKALTATLRQMWNTEPDKQGAVGPVNPTFGQYVFMWAGALLGGPASQSTKAALYRLLAAEPGIQAIPNVTDQLGRTGVAVGDGTGDYLLIDPHTGGLLATTTYAVHAGGTIPVPAGGTEAIITEGWTNTLRSTMPS